MGARVDDPVLPLDVGREVGIGWIAVKGELQDLHPGQAKAIPQGLHLRGDHAQVFGDQRQR